jgi:hypothetical protein
MIYLLESYAFGKELCDHVVLVGRSVVISVVARIRLPHICTWFLRSFNVGEENLEPLHEPCIFCDVVLNGG